MADVEVEKKLKLANTRKRFKELQELKKKRNDQAHALNENDTSNSHKTSNRNTPVEPTVPPKGDNEETNQPLPNNYFGQPDDQNSAAFFDNIATPNVPEKPHNDISPSLLTYFNTSEDEENTSQSIGLPRYFDNINSSECIWENTVPEKKGGDSYRLFPHQENDVGEEQPLEESATTDDVLCQDYSEIKRNEISDYARSAGHRDLGPISVSPYDVNNLENLFSPTDNQKLMDYLGSTGATEEEKNGICHTNDEIDDSINVTKREIQDCSNVESLKQLSDQFAQMIEPSYDYSAAGSITDLEKRNIELAAELDKEKVISEQLQAKNYELQVQITRLETESTKQELELNFQNVQEVTQLKNELQTHLQTIGLLVAEKTELSSNLSQYEISCKQKTAECEELQARLRASRSRVADLERELGNLKSEQSKAESVGEHYSTSLENFKQEYRILKDQKDELAQDLLEVREKLKNTLEENVKLQQDLKDVSTKLSLADIKIQQLSSGGALGIDSQVEQLTQEKFALESELANLNQMLKSIVKERDESTVQFQQYAQQLNAQITNLSSKLEQLQQEKESLVVQEQNRIKHIGELERQLQNLQNDQVTYATRSSSNSDLKNELERSRELCVQLQIEKTTVEESFTKASNEKDLLLKELEAKTDSISQLESMVEQLRGNQPDSVKLLATMESDKVAASRAIQQNKELKQQLEGMQEVVMKMDNDKVVLTENLKGQQQTNKELVEKLQKTELTLQSLADAIDIKDKELTHLREASEEMNRHAIHQEQLEDRLRHYEAHDNSAHILKHELQDAKQTIVKLTNELNKVKDAQQTVLELTNEPKDNIIIEPQDKIDRNKNILDKEHAMKYLEEKVKKTMQEIADLTDEKQRLEHIVIQLQGETETIGEYVALYQHQRMVLKQKAVENDQQLKQLANDREQIKIKLDRLNELIRKLVIEKGALPQELLQHQESMNSQINNFCEVHSQIHEDINKIKQSNVIEPASEIENETAEEIINLLSEIKTSNLVQPDENFHHCPWCSGQLMTV